MPNYANIVKSSQGNVEGGFKPSVYFNPVADITTFVYPTAAGVVLGDKTNIASAHTWGTNKGAFTWEGQIGSVVLNEETQGDEGAKVPIWTARVKIAGLDAATIEQMKNALNEQLVVWLKDANCLVANNYFQLGDECNPVTVEHTHDSKTNSTTSTGQKEWEVIFRSKKLYTYAAALDTTF